MNFSKNKPTEQNHQRHAFTSSHPHQVTRKIQKKDHTSSCTIHQVVIQILWKKINPTMLLCNSSFYKSNKKKIHTRADFKNWVVKSTKFHILKPAFFCSSYQPQFIYFYTALPVFLLVYANKTCSKCETNQTGYKNRDTEVAKANPTSSKSFSELGNIF